MKRTTAIAALIVLGFTVFAGGTKEIHAAAPELDGFSRADAAGVDLQLRITGEALEVQMSARSRCIWPRRRRRLFHLPRRARVGQNRAVNLDLAVGWSRGLYRVALPGSNSTRQHVPLPVFSIATVPSI
jgi:hypothetical protein